MYVCGTEYTYPLAASLIRGGVPSRVLNILLTVGDNLAFLPFPTATVCKKGSYARFKATGRCHAHGIRLPPNSESTVF